MVTKITTREQFLEFRNDNTYATVFFGVPDPANSPRFWKFLQLATTQEGNDAEIAFGYVATDEDIIAEFA